MPINEKTESWYNYFSIESNQIKAKELLDPFRKEKQKEFDFELQEEYNLVFPTAGCISSVQFTVPSGGPFEDLEINETLQDSRLIPLTEAGEHISKRFIKQYVPIALACPRNRTYVRSPSQEGGLGGDVTRTSVRIAPSVLVPPCLCRIVRCTRHKTYVTYHNSCHVA